jgi:hypothetical protein
MLFMNDWDIENAMRRFHPDETPNLATGAHILAALANWTDHNSDGWCYWPKPVRAAKSLMTLLQAGEERYRNAYYDEVADATAAELKRALSPIKAFLTRQGVSHDVLILGRTPR